LWDENRRVAYYRVTFEGHAADADRTLENDSRHGFGAMQSKDLVFTLLVRLLHQAFRLDKIERMRPDAVIIRSFDAFQPI
jgi:hypothetical protein